MNTERGFWLALPEGWTQVPADAASFAAIDALVTQFAPALEHAGIPVAEAQAELRAVAHDIDNFDVVFAASWAAGTDDAVVQANLTALLIGAGTIAELDDPLWDLTTIHDETHDRTIMRRTRIRTTDGISARLGLRRVGTAEYFVEVPGRPLWLLITFTSPTIPLWDDLLELFDAIAKSARFG